MLKDANVIAFSSVIAFSLVKSSVENVVSFREEASGRRRWTETDAEACSRFPFALRATEFSNMV